MIIRIARIIFGASILIVGLGGVLLSVLALADPVGTKMADDSDPLGQPMSRVGSLASAGVSALIAWSGLWLLIGRSKRAAPAEHKLRSSEHERDEGCP
jgi:hypothetical protein